MSDAHEDGKTTEGIALPCTDIGQFAEKRLRPVRGVFDIYDYQLDYYYKVRKILLTGSNEKPIIRFLVLPSFTPENVLEIKIDSDNNSAYLVYRICEEMIWYCKKNWEYIKTIEFKSEIDLYSVALIKNLFDMAISQVNYSDVCGLGIDGTSYYFSIYDVGWKTGTVWSPHTGKMKKLVGIGKKLIELVSSDNEIITFDAKFQSEIEELIQEF